MIKKLRRRFIAVNMCILTCVLLGVLTGIYVYMYSSEVRISYELMESILNERGAGIIEPDKMHVPDIEENADETKAIVNMGRQLEYEDNRFPDSNDKYPYHEGDDPFSGRPFFPGGGQHNTRPDFPDWDRPEPSGESGVQEQPAVPAAGQTGSGIVSESTQTEKAVTTAVKDIPEEKEKVTSAYEYHEEITAPSSESAGTAETGTSGSTEKIISGAVSGTDALRPPFDKDFPDPYKGSVKRAHILVMFSRENEIEGIVYQYFDDVDESAVESAAKSLINSSSDKGKITIGNYKLRYMKTENPRMMNGGYRLLFLDRTLEISTINRLLFIFIIIGSVGIIVIFGISILLANWMIKPVEKAWKQQKQFVADASHELKTPLTVISSNTDVILSSPGDTVESQTKWLNYIKEETKRMTKLVNNMLYIAKYDSNEIKFVTKNFNLSDVMSCICLQYEALFFEEGKTLETNIDEDIFVNGDEDKLKQLINILLDNAWKYSTDKGRIKAALSKDHKTGKTILEVSNTSGYIPSEKLERLFDRFYRLDNSRNRKTGGSGLGLNIARSIAESHGGRIYARHENSITYFIVELV